jgi:membrane associated rhomboid family serine protease
MPGHELPPAPPGTAGEEPPDRAAPRMGPLRAAPRAPVTWALIAVLVLCFAASALRGVDLVSPTAKQLLDAGGMFGPALVRGEWWRLFTAALLHAGPVHLLFNVWALRGGGRAAEPAFGAAGFLAIYVLSTLGASLLSVAVHPLVVSVGASGSIFGVFGALLAFPIVHRRAIPRAALKQQLQGLATFLLINLAYGLSNPHVDLAAHAGGFLTGLVAGLLLRRDPLRPSAHVRRRVAGAVALAALLAAAAFGVRERVARVPEVRLREVLGQALAAHQAGRYEAAVRLYTSCLEIERGDDVCLFNRGLANMALERGAAALADLRASEKGIDPAKRLEALCEAAARFGGDDEKGTEAAVQDCTRAVERDPSSLPALRLRAYLYARQGKADEALSDLNRAIALAPGDRSALELRAMLLGSQRRYGEAEKDCAALAKLARPERALPAFCAALAGPGK